MRYPQFFEMYRDAIKNTWTVDEIDFSDDLVDLDRKLMPAEKHLINRLVAFFATGDSIVSNNLVLNLYKHINAPEARMYLSRQLYEEALHVQFYLTLLDNYIPDLDERAAAFAAIENIPSIRAEGRVLLQWMDSVSDLDEPRHPEDRRELPAEPDLLRHLHRGAVLLRRIRLRLLPALQGPAQRPRRRHQLGVPRRELPHELRARGGQHRAQASSPSSSTSELAAEIRQMLDEAVDVRVPVRAGRARPRACQGMSLADTRSTSQFVADQRLVQLGLEPTVRRRRTRSASWSSRTSRSSRTSSSAPSPPTRSGVAGRRRLRRGLLDARPTRTSPTTRPGHGAGSCAFSTTLRAPAHGWIVPSIPPTMLRTVRSRGKR